MPRTVKAHHRRATVTIHLAATVSLDEHGQQEIRDVHLTGDPPVVAHPDLESRPHNPWFEGGVWVSDPNRTQRDRQTAATITAAANAVMIRLRQALDGQACMCCVDNECECHGTHLGPASWPPPQQ